MMALIAMAVLPTVGIIIHSVAITVPLDFQTLTQTKHHSKAARNNQQTNEKMNSDFLRLALLMQNAESKSIVSPPFSALCGTSGLTEERGQSMLSLHFL